MKPINMAKLEKYRTETAEPPQGGFTSSVPSKLSKNGKTKAGASTGGAAATLTASDMREEFLEYSVDVMRNMLARARGEAHNTMVDIKASEAVWNALVPIIHAAGDKVNLDHLATMTPQERADAILHAVAIGAMSPKAARELIGLMTDMAQMTGQIGSGADSKLIINLAPIELNNSTDNTLAGEYTSTMRKT